MSEQQQANEQEIAKLWRQDVRRGDLCEVRDLRHNTRQSGRIQRPSRGGCDVRFDDGHIAFIHWGNLFPAAAQPRKTPNATLGEAVGEQLERAKLSLVHRPAPPPQPSLPMLPPAPATTQSEPVKTLRGRKPHHISAIGHIFRTERLKRMLDQDQMGMLLHSSYAQISKIELGDVTPSDELLLRFSEEFKVPVELLESARDGEEYAADPVKALVRIAELETEVKRLDEHQRRAEQLSSTVMELRDQLKQVSTERDALLLAASQRQAPNVALTVEAFMDVLEFTSRFAQLKPIPADAEKRAAWYRVAFVAHEQMGRI